MTGTEAPVPPARAQQFLAAVEAACADLPDAERGRLLGGLEEHLAELAADGVDLVAELGDPVAYAHELRAAAGVTSGATAGTPAGVTHAVAPGGANGAPAGPATLALPLGPPTTALPLGQPGSRPGGQSGQPWSQPPGPATGAGVRPGPSTAKVLLVVGAVLAGIAVLVTAAVVLGGLFLFGASSSGTVAPAATAPAPATDVAILVPDVVGTTADSGRDTLTAAGLTTASLVVTSTPRPAGSAGNVVVAQDPAAGTTVAPGTTVTLTITKG